MDPENAEQEMSDRGAHQGREKSFGHLYFNLFFPLMIFAFMATVSARAEEAESLRGAGDPIIEKECGACHMAYRARWLSAGAWRRVMAHLDDHFGEDASLGAEERDRITEYLVAHARQSEDEEIRITRTHWWKRKHREVGAGQWTRASSPANCGGCHRLRKGTARRGFFERLFGDDDD